MVRSDQEKIQIIHFLNFELTKMGLDLGELGEAVPVSLCFNGFFLVSLEVFVIVRSSFVVQIKKKIDTYLLCHHIRLRLGFGGGSGFYQELIWQPNIVLYTLCRCSVTYPCKVCMGRIRDKEITVSVFVIVPFGHPGLGNIVNIAFRVSFSIASGT
jgi:hypothetical protein